MADRIKYKNSRNAGHRAGLNTVEKIIKETIKKNKISYIICFLYRKLEKAKKRNKLFI